MINKSVSFAVILAFLLTGIAMAEIPDPTQATRRTQEQAIKASFAKLPLSFIKNEGQMDETVLFYEHGRGHTTAFTKEGVSLSLMKAEEGKKGTSETVTLIPVGASPFTIEALDRKEAKVHYFIGKDPKRWKTDIPTYGAVLYKNLYPGIDMKFYGSNSQLEYDIIVFPGADPSKVRLSYKGIKKLTHTPQGELEIVLEGGSIFQKKPSLYQTVEGKRTEIEGAFVLLDATTYGFKVGAYDKDRPLIIDPALAYCRYLGTYWYAALEVIAVDSSGSAYVAGIDGFKNPNWPPTVDAAFIGKLTPSGNNWVYSTYMGGNDSVIVRSIAVDSSGNVYAAGRVSSAGFATKNAFQASYGGGYGDAFIMKLDPSGGHNLYFTYLGGSGSDGATGIAIDSLGNAYVSGWTDSADFPIHNAFQATYGGNRDAFIAKLAPSGDILVYSTYLGGSKSDSAEGIAIDSLENVYVAGSTNSEDFPIHNPFQATYGGNGDAFIARLSPSGDSLVYSTYLGGDRWDTATSIAVDSSGSAYVTGETASFGFPTKNPYQEALRGDKDAFITKLSPSGDSLVYSTYLGGNKTDTATSIAVHSSGSAYVAGWTNSLNFPIRDPYQEALSGDRDAFITKLSPSGDSLVYSTFFGKSRRDEARGIAVDSWASAYVAGFTESIGAGGAGFVIKLDGAVLFVSKWGKGSGTVTSDPVGINCGTGCSSGVGVGAIVTLTAKADTGSSFAGWTGCDSTPTPSTGVTHKRFAASSEETCTVTMTGDISVTAGFVLNTYTLTALKAGKGSGTLSATGLTCSGNTCSGTYDYNAQVAVTATPASDSVFTGFTGCDSTQGNICMVRMLANRTVTAAFGYKRALAVAKSGSGSGTVTSSPPGIYCGSTCYALFDLGSLVTLVASADTGSSFAGWTGCDSADSKNGKKGGASGTTCTVTMSAAKSVDAKFTVNTYVLTGTKTGTGTGTLTSAGLSCNGSTCTGTYSYNTKVDIRAVAAAGTAFDGWTGCDSASGNSCIVTMTSNKKVTASFTAIGYTLTATQAGSGTGTFSGAGLTCDRTTCTGTYSYNMALTIMAVPSSGSSFAFWTGCDSSSGNACVLTMTANRTITATFIAMPTALAVIKSGLGTVTSSPAGINCGASCQASFATGTPMKLSAFPDTGYGFAYWSGICSGAATTCSVTLGGGVNVAGASFVPVSTHQYRLTTVKKRTNAGDGTIASADGTINCGPTCTRLYYPQATITLTARPSTGSTFTGWTGACSGKGACSVTMNHAKAVQAVFAGPVRLTVLKQHIAKGDGTIVSSPSGINCGSTCSASYAPGSTIILTATPAEGSIFYGWKPATSTCSTGTCTVTLNAAKNVTAVFVGPQHLTVTKKRVGGGDGTVVSSPAGIDCGATCTGSFTYNRHVTLTATPASGSTFAGWTPQTMCKGTGTCTVTMNGAKSVSATFKKKTASPGDEGMEE